MNNGLRIRQAVRAVITTPDDSVLLVRFEFPTVTMWALPGGGLDPGEDHLTALHRELHEEVGLVDADIGPHIWNREHVIAFLDGQWDGQNDAYYHVPVAARFEPTPALTPDQLRAERLHELRWWTTREIAHATTAGTRFAPASLAELLRRLADEGPPHTPLDTGV